MTKTVSFSDYEVSRDKLRNSVPHMNHIVPADAYFVARPIEADNREINRWVAQNTKGWFASGYLPNVNLYAFEHSSDATFFRLRF